MYYGRCKKQVRFASGISQKLEQKRLTSMFAWDFWDLSIHAILASFYLRALTSVTEAIVACSVCFLEPPYILNIYGRYILFFWEPFDGRVSYISASQSFNWTSKYCEIWQHTVLVLYWPPYTRILTEKFKFKINLILLWTVWWIREDHWQL